MKHLLLRITLSFALSGFFLWLAFRSVDLRAAWDQVQHVRPWSVAGFALALLLIQVCRILRWGILIQPFAEVPVRGLFRIGNVGWMLILALPLRLGELARPYLLKKEAGVPLSSGLGSVAVERSIDGLLVTFLFFASTFALPATYAVPAGLKVAALLSLALFGSATVVIVAALVAQAPVMRLIERVGNRFSVALTARALGMLEAFITGLRALPNLRAVAAFVVLTLLYWAANGFGYYLIMLGFGWDLPPLAAFMLVSVVVIGIMIPAGPGFLGTFQSALLAGLAVFGIDATAAGAFGLVVYPITVLVVVGLGLPYLFVSGRPKLRDLVPAGDVAGAAS